VLRRVDDPKRAGASTSNARPQQKQKHKETSSSSTLSAQVFEASYTLHTTKMNALKRKTPSSADTEPQRRFKIPRVPQPSKSAGRPIIKMIVEDVTKNGTVTRILLDTGCTIPLIDNRFAK